MNARSQPSTKSAERAPRSKIKSPADAATSNGAATKPSKGSGAKRTPAQAKAHHNGGVTPVERVLALLGDYDREGDGFIAHCPAHEDSNPSLRITEGDDGRALLTCRANCKTETIVERLSLTMADLFPATNPNRRKVSKKRTPPAPQPKRSTRKPRKVKELSDEDFDEARKGAREAYPRMRSERFKLTALYPYRHADGSVWGWRGRWEHPLKSKEIKPFHRDGDWLAKEAPAPRAGKPLYLAPETIASVGPVFVVEGEKCADALTDLGLVATTSGSSSTAKGADWSPVYGREVRIWPDYDDPGDKYAADVAAQLGDQAQVKLVDVESLGLKTTGADAVDWLAAHPQADADAVLDLELIDPPEVDTVELICAADVEAEPIQWIWEEWLALSMFHLVAGEGATGKTTLMLSIIAAITSGGKLPDGSIARAGNVVIWSGEDSIAYVLKPRLLAAGANLDRVFFIGQALGNEEGPRAFDPAIDIAKLEAKIAKTRDVVLVLVDPVVNAITGDSHKNAEVRRGLQPLVDLASRRNVAVVGISHFAKNTEGHKTPSRFLGSVAFVNLARIALATVKGRNGECRLVRCKNNIGPTGDGFSYEMEPVPLDYGGAHNKVSRITWGEPIFGDASELLDAVEAKRLPRDDASDWLCAQLADRPVWSNELKERAEADGLAWRTVQRAKAACGIDAFAEGNKNGERGCGRWMWKLPESRGVAERSRGAKSPKTRSKCQRK